MSGCSPRDFVHLHVHSDYSLLDGACSIGRLLGHVGKLGMESVALTDHGNLFGAVDFFSTAAKLNKTRAEKDLPPIKPILGCEIYLVTHSRTERPERAKHRIYHMGLLARNATGYANLTKLVSDAHINGMYFKPRCDFETLAAHADGLIGFTGCLAALIPQTLLNEGYDKAREHAARFIDIFGKDHFFVEIQDHGIPEQRQIIPDLLKLATEFDLKVVATNDSHYVEQSDAPTHDALLCIQTGNKVADENRMRFDNDQFYIKSVEEMERLFSERPDSIRNTRAVAEMCDFQLPFDENHYPVYERPVDLNVIEDRKHFDSILDIYVEKKNEVNARDGKDLIKLSDDERADFRKNGLYLFDLCKQGLEKRYDVNYDRFRQAQESHSEDTPEPEQFEKTTWARAKQVCDQLDYELAIITGTGFVDYFLIVWDFIAWARNRDIPVGPGRGSGAGCVVAYVLQITDIDPLRFGLLFERMLNLERVSPPDFDVDFCMRRRDEVVNYVREKYGHDCVANIITFGTFGAKMVMRDIARVLDVPFAEADRITKMVPDELNISLEDALAKSSELQNEVEINPLAKKIFEHGKIIEGMVRNTGKHACGVIIGDQPLHQIIPLCKQEGDLTTQYPKGPVEDLGMLKMDFLGLKTLTVISDAQENVRRTEELPDFNIETVALDDPDTYSLLNSGQTTGVFQLESGGMQQLCRQIGLSQFEEIIALIALYRPGPMQFIPQFIEGKRDPSKIQIPHPLVEDLVNETYGVLVYQEQVMQCAQIIAGYTLGGADILRRAMGKKIASVMEAQKQVFIAGAKEHNNIEKPEAERIFGILEKFAQYGFNKSHSAAYAMLSYRTAYLKANYPVQFMAALLSADLGNADKLAHFIGECEALKIPVLGPDINESRENFTPVGCTRRGDGSKANGNRKKHGTGFNLAEQIGEGSIRFGLAAIKGVGDAAAKSILAERDEHGPFEDFRNFIERIDTKAVNKRVIENLIKTGAFDYSGEDRGILMDNVEGLLSEAASMQRDREAGQANFFDMMLEEPTANGASASNGNGTALHGSKMSEKEKLQHEKDLLGFYVSGHPLDEFAGLAQGLCTFRNRADLAGAEDRDPFRLCAVINTVDKKVSKKDNRPWAILTLNTKTALFEAMMFADAYGQYMDNVIPGECVLVTGSVSRREHEEPSLRVDHLTKLGAALSSQIESVLYVVKPEPGQLPDFLDILHTQAERNTGATRIQIGMLMEDNHLLMSDVAQSLSVRVTGQFHRPLSRHPIVVGTKLTAPEPEPEEPIWKRRKRSS